jgi:lipopolysaccharide assembly outer membrane protein LptD (OstA)
MATYQKDAPLPIGSAPLYIYRYIQLLLVLLFSMTTLVALGQENQNAANPKSTFITDLDTTAKDTTRKPLTKAQKDSLTIDSLKKNADLAYKLEYSASDSIVLDMKDQAMYMYQDGKTVYDVQTLQAHRIRVAWKENMIYAKGIPDSTGNLIGTPVVKEKEDTYYAEEMAYNMRTRKGKITLAKTNQKGDIVSGQIIKRNPDNTFYIRDGSFTTCDADHPHFYIRAKKIKMIPNDRIISGPLYMVMADVPIPIVVPFGYFPFRTKRSSGLIMPSYGRTNDRGFFFRNMGFYWAASEYFDVRFLGDIYTNGSWRMNVASDYISRYGPKGAISLEYSNEFLNSPGDPDFRPNSGFFVNWRHDQPLSPTGRLTANVRVGSSNFLQRNRFDVNQNLQNSLQSSVSYTKSFPRYGWNLTSTIESRQNLAQQRNDLTLPTIVLNKDRIFPFKKAVPTGKTKWFEQIGVQYSTELQNRLANAHDSIMFQPEMWKEFRNGMQHRAGVNTNFKLFKFFTLTPNFNYNERWYLESTERTYQNRFVDTTINSRDTTFFVEEVRTKDIPGFVAARDFNTSMTMNTILYGYLITNSKRKRAFRHVVTPTFSYNFTPDFSDNVWGAYRTVQTNERGGTLTYSRFERGIFGGPGRGMQQTLSFALSNQVQMKYLSDKEQAKSDTGKKKFSYITLVDNLGTNLSYNFAADSLNLSTIPVSFRNNILNNLINLNASLNFDPYKIDTVIDRRVNTFTWQNGRFPTLTNASFAIAFTLKPKEKKKDEVKPAPNSENRELTEKEKLMKRYSPFEWKWNLSFNYTANVTNQYQRQLNAFKENIIHSLNVNGNLAVTKNWNMSGTSNYDFATRRVGTSSITITRNLHCWEMSFNATPFGRFQRYLLTINVRANTLKDLKLEKRREWQDLFTTNPF